MKRVIISLVLIALLSLSAFAAIMDQYKSPFDFPRRGGVERVTHYDPRVGIGEIQTVSYLQPTVLQASVGVGRGGYQPIFPRGVARIHSSEWDGYPKGHVEVTTKDLEATDRSGYQFEAWLVDEDSGYRLSLGTFPTQFGGAGRLNFDADLYFDAYDTVQVTAEPLNDLDPSPGEVVLQGPIQKSPGYYNPPPASKKLVTDSIRLI